MRKQFATMNQRDKGLLIFLLAIVLGFISYYFIMTPALTLGAELKAQKELAQKDLERSQAIVAQLPELKKSEAEKKEELSKKYEVFFYELKQERILNKLDELMNQVNLPVTAYEPTMAVADTIKVTQDTYTALDYPLLSIAAKTNPELLPADISQEGNQNPTDQGQSPQSGEAAADAVPTSDIIIKVNNTSYPVVMNFIKRVENLNKAVILKNVALKKGDAGLEGQVVISVFSMPKLDESEKDYLGFLPAAALGKADPFQ